MSAIEEINRELEDIEALENSIGSTPRLAEREREAQKQLTAAMDAVDSKKRALTAAERETATELADALADVREEFESYAVIMNRALYARSAFEAARKACRNGDAPMTEPWIPRLSQRAQAERLAGDSSLYLLLRSIGSLDLAM